MIGYIVQRKSRRGAAMVEAIAVIPVLTMMFAAMVYLNNLYSMKQLSMRNSREAAWTLARNACEGLDRKNSGGSDPLDDAAQGGFQQPPDVPGDIDLGESTGESDGGKGKKTVDDAKGVFTKSSGWFISTATSTDNREVSGWAMVANKRDKDGKLVKSNDTRALSTTTKVTCNEVENGGSDLFEVLKTAWNYLTPWKKND